MLQTDGQDAYEILHTDNNQIAVDEHETWCKTAVLLYQTHHAKWADIRAYKHQYRSLFSGSSNTWIYSKIQ